MTQAWPVFDLVVRTPSLELRGATDDLLNELTTVAADVIVPGTLPFDGNASFYEPSPTRERRWLQGQWSARARIDPKWWCLTLAVIVDGQPIGTQEITAQSFPLLRTVQTFSWIGRRFQGRGIGKEMRAAVLHLAFAGLDAERAESEAFHDNGPSRGVSLALGYEPNGIVWALRHGQPAPMSRWVLTRDVWERQRRDDIEIEGLPACRELLRL